jgi:5-oxoprolinase (ATP-hydrolysing) subunit A
MPLVDLNVDLGELPDEPRDLYALATVANIACGGHAGDKASMARALSCCVSKGTRVAAHPSYPDREGFGRRTVVLSADELEASIAEQCAALQALAKRLGYPVRMVKPHGALYHDAARSEPVARAFVAGAARGLAEANVELVGPTALADPLRSVARDAGFGYLREGFADRRTAPDGTLVPRSDPSALITDPASCARQAIALASSGSVDTICVHGDTPGALDIARAVRDGLVAAGLLAGAV